MATDIKHKAELMELFEWCKRNNASIDESCGYVEINIGSTCYITTSIDGVNGVFAIFDDDTGKILRL